MATPVEQFTVSASKLGAQPQRTGGSIFFDHVSLKVTPSVDDPEPKSYELVWPSDDEHAETFAAALYESVLGEGCDFPGFLKAAEASMDSGCGYSESHGKWAVRMFRRQDCRHLYIVDVTCLETTGHCGSRMASG